MAPTLPNLALSVDGPIGRLTLDRPDKLNALTPEMQQGLIEAAQWFNQRQEVSVVVLGGNGRSFSAGVDLESLRSGMETRAEGLARLGADLGDAIEGMRPITIAALHGHVVGGGVVIASACDLRVAADDASFSIPEVDLGIPWLWGGIPRFIRHVPPAIAKELVMTCRPFTAEEAASWGYLNRVVDPERVEASALELAAEVAGRPGVLLDATKRQFASAMGTGPEFTDEEALQAALGEAAE